MVSFGKYYKAFRKSRSFMMNIDKCNYKHTCYFWLPSQNSGAFWIISCSSPCPPTPSPTLYNVETWNKFWIQVCIVVCGVEEGFGMCDLKNAPKLQICPMTFIHDCSKHKFYHALFILSFTSENLWLVCQSSLIPSQTVPPNDLPL